MSGGGLEKVSSDMPCNFDMPNNTSSMNYALKSVPGLADVGVPHGDEDGPRTPPRCLEGGLEKVSIDMPCNFDMLNNVSSMIYVLKSVPGLADVGVPHGDEDGPRTPPRCRRGSGKSFK